MRWFSKSPGGGRKNSLPLGSDRWGEPPLCELNFLGKNGEQQEIGYGKKGPREGDGPRPWKCFMIVGTIPLQTGRATPILIEVQVRNGDHVIATHEYENNAMQGTQRSNQRWTKWPLKRRAYLRYGRDSL